MTPIRRLAILAIAGALTAPSARIARADQTTPIRLYVDATDAGRKLFHGKLTFQVSPGPLTLVYPKWIPGEHGPTGPVTDYTGLVFSAGGKTLSWQRDPVDMYAFHVVVPQGASELVVAFDFLGATTTSGFSSAASATPNLAVLAWNDFVLYPEGTKSDEVTFAPSLTVPADWTLATALTVTSHAGADVSFAPVRLTTLVDSPVLTGRYFRAVPLDGGPRPVELDIAADSRAALAISPESEAAMKQLVREADALFGARHYDHYNFFLSLSDHIAHFGLEHHQCNDTRLAERTLIDDKLKAGLAVLSHEYVHSWNGKYRRPAGLATASYQDPMKGGLLWVYEGLTEYLGYLLAARSGLWSTQYYVDRLAHEAAYYDHVRGRDWRPLQDTCDAAQLLYPAPNEWEMSRRGTDFYNEGWLLWLDVDTKVRELTKGKRTLDDFCQRFHGGQSGPPELRPYTVDEVVSTLNDVAPFDWQGFFASRVTDVNVHAPLDGVERGGWRLIYNDEKNDYVDELETGSKKVVEAAFSIGLRIRTDGTVQDVVPASPAFAADIGPDMTVVAIDGRKFSPDVLRDALKARSKEPLTLLIENQEFFATRSLDYHDGLRMPHIERVAKAPDVLGQILTARAPEKGKK
jgi:predicted metalloprotease with PDZ domain